MDGHEELIELLGAYALDAVTDDERVAVEPHLAVCARCRAEVADHRNVAASLGAPAAATGAPDLLWTRIAGDLDLSGRSPGDTAEEGGAGGADRRPGPPPLALFDVPPDQLTTLAQPAGPITSGRATAPVIGGSARFRPPRLVGRVVLIAAVVALVIITAVAVFAVFRTHRTNQDLQAQIAEPSLAVGAQRVSDDPSSTRFELRTAAGDVPAVAVVSASGEGYFIAGTMEPTTTDRTYQLWQVDERGAISLGVLGNEPGIVGFHVQGPIQTIAVTNEAAGGSPSPQSDPLMSATA